MIVNKTKNHRDKFFFKLLVTSVEPKLIHNNTFI